MTNALRLFYGWDKIVCVWASKLLRLQSCDFSDHTESWNRFDTIMKILFQLKVCLVRFLCDDTRKRSKSQNRACTTFFSLITFVSDRERERLHVQLACVVSQSVGRQTGAEHRYVSYRQTTSSWLITVQSASRTCTHTSLSVIWRQEKEREGRGDLRVYLPILENKLFCVLTLDSVQRILFALQHACLLKKQNTFVFNWNNI